MELAGQANSFKRRRINDDAKRTTAAPATRVVWPAPVVTQFFQRADS